MIKFRINPLDAYEKELDIDFSEGESLSSIFKKVMSDQDIAEEAHQFYIVLVDGEVIDKEFWDKFNPSKESKILVAASPKGGSFRETFRMIAIITVTLVATYFLGPAGGGTLQGLSLSAAVAATTIGTSLLLSKLLPPIVTGLGELGLSSGSSLEESQMYAITSQTNSVKKFGMVPQVYGTYKLYPNIVANPYTELRVDPASGELIQFFTAIYDFGFGPLNVRDLKIGDTPIEDYTDVSFRFVDLNKPTVSEGVWDDNLNNSFKLYKGIFESEDLSYALNYNQNDGAVLSNYRVEREFPGNTATPRELSLMFACGGGLTSYFTNGNRGTATIELDIKFAKVGTEDWKNFNDVTYVDDPSVVGGSHVTEVDFNFFYDWVNNGSVATSYFRYLDVFASEDTYFPAPYWTKVGETTVVSYQPKHNSRTFTLGISKGKNWFYNNEVINLNTVIKVGGVSIGKVINNVLVSGVYKVYLDKMITENIPLYSAKQYLPTTTEHVGPYGGPTSFVTTFSPLTTAVTKLKTCKKFYGTAVVKISANQTNTVYSQVRFTPKEVGDYKVRVDRVRSYAEGNYQVYDNLSLIQLGSREEGIPILTDKRHVFLEVNIKATNQLNGALQNLSGICTSVLDVYDPNTQTWSKQPTSNPAWVFADLMTGQINKRPIPKSRLDVDSLVEWSEYCDTIPTAKDGYEFAEKRYQTNFILDYSTTLREVLNNVANSCQASLNMLDGKYGVMIDKKRTTPVQVFTERNTKDFSSTRDLSSLPDALKVKYEDTTQDAFQIAEKVVYNDGFTELTAETFEEVQSFACTNQEQAWRLGRYTLAQNKLRREVISISVDFEHLVCTRGDYVKYVQSIMKVGGTPARVKSFSGNRIVIDNDIIYETGFSYGYLHRSKTGVITTSTLTVVSADTFDLNGPIPAIGDLIVIGKVDNISYDCLVKTISPNSDLTATLTLVELANEIHDSDFTEGIPVYNPRLNAEINSELVAPPLVENLRVLRNTWEVKNSDYEYFIELDWDVPTGAIYELFEIYVDRGTGYELTDYVNDSLYKYIVDKNFLGVEHKFKVLGVSANGKKKALGEAEFVYATPLEKLTPPSDVDGLYLNVTGETIQIDWRLIPDPDCKEYMIRYSPIANALWETSTILQRVSSNTSMVSLQARTGTYLIKAIDLNDNQSNNCAKAQTSIPALTNLNVLTETTEFPTLGGSLDTVEYLDGGLVLKKKSNGEGSTTEYYPEGYYYFKDFLELDDIYTIRLQTLIKAEGFTPDDLMANWLTLAELDFMANSKFSEWNVEAQYRSTDQFLSIANWAKMSDINPISEGYQEKWTEWRLLSSIGDFTGKIFQFRLKLISNKANVTPRVLDGVIRADVPDRIERFNNIQVPVEGYNIVYTPSFMGPGTTPSVYVTQDAMQQGDRVVLENRTLDGVTIKVYDLDDNPVARQVDVLVSGYGRRHTEVL